MAGNLEDGGIAGLGVARIFFEMEPEQIQDSEEDL
jgi:hypothetical protein